MKRALKLTPIAIALTVGLTAPAHAWKVSKGDVVQLKLTDAGNLGIGTINPDPYRLAVRGSTDDATGYALWVSGATTTTVPGIVVRNDGNVGINTAPHRQAGR